MVGARRPSGLMPIRRGRETDKLIRPGTGHNEGGGIYEMTTSDGQGINWKWLATLLISIVGGLLVICVSLALTLRSSDTAKICSLETTVNAIKTKVDAIETDQKWVKELLQEHRSHTEKEKKGG